MALAALTYTFAEQYVYSWLYSAPKKSENPIKIGVLCTASINPVSIIHPAETHPDVVLYAVASRDAKKARQYAKSYGFQKAHSSYEQLLADPEVELVYISVPNGLHFEWAFKALEAGKHVLLEKPFTSNAIEARKLVEKSKMVGKECMEAFHWQFHPAAHRFRQILDEHTTNSGRGPDERFAYASDGRFGPILKTHARMTTTPAIPKGDIRWRYDLSGGSLMDMTYALSFTRYALRAKLPKDVVYAKVRSASRDTRVDSAMEAMMKFICRDDIKKGEGRLGSSVDVESTIYTDMARDLLMGFIPRLWELPSIFVDTERAEVYFYNAILPHTYHYIAVKDKSTGHMTYESIYKGGPLWKERGESHWSTFRYQLEAVVDKLRGREPVWWVSGEDSIAQMETIDSLYKKSGLSLRSTSALAVDV
ncbi:hypothetical protein APHAL10511_000577 [Amanita phalloides]|nr:hypothetical protein APHAL10511_000577 [Amanita phalloides]